MATNEPSDSDVYQAPDSVVRPGDIVRLSPTLKAIRTPLVHTGREMIRSSNVTAELLGRGDSVAVPDAVKRGEKDTKFVVPGKLDFGVLMTRGCDIDNTKLRQVAAIRPLSTIQGDDNQIAVIEGRHKSLFFLPRAQSGPVVLFDRSYVDFRYIVTLHEDHFSTLDRPISVTRNILLDMYFCWLRHTTGKEIKQQHSCPHCGNEVDPFQDVLETIAPGDDY